MGFWFSPELLAPNPKASHAGSASILKWTLTLFSRRRTQPSAQQDGHPLPKAHLPRGPQALPKEACQDFLERGLSIVFSLRAFRRSASAFRRTRGLVAKCGNSSSVETSLCLNFWVTGLYRLLLGATLGRLWGPGGKGARGPPRDNPGHPNRVIRVPLGCLRGPGGLPRGAGSLQETTQEIQSRPPASEARVFFENVQT